MQELQLYFTEVENDWEDRSSQHLFTYVVTPNLALLQVYYDRRTCFDSNLADTISTLLSRSKCSLKSFFLQNFYFSNENEED